MQDYLQQTEQELRLRNYSQKTNKSYIYCLGEYFNYKISHLNLLDINNVKKFLLEKQAGHYSPQTINLYLNAIKFFYREIIKTTQPISVKFAKRSAKLPVVLNRDEVQKIISALANAKHRLILALAYGAGLRVSETVNLKVKDLQLDELSVHLKNGKGNRDRITVCPEKIKNDLKNLIAGKDSFDYVFASEHGGKLSERTAQKIFEQALKKSGVKKPATFHSLRHSFATHLLENGVDVRYIQELLGHQNIRTTQLYTKVTNPQLKNIKSPF